MNTLATPDNSVSSDDSLDDYRAAHGQRLERALREHLQPRPSPFSIPDTSPGTSRLLQAMHYSVMNGGKRVRALLLYASAEAVHGGSEERFLEQLDLLACALEFVHAYSLIHDDLPAMDDDDLRRGQPTCHRAFDEATAILAGDALQSEAFSLVTAASLPAEARLQLVRCLAEAIGARGMVGGQAIDLDAVNRMISLPELEAMHSLKTGALIRASIAMGAIAAGADDNTLAELDAFGLAIGLAFQVQDDILDVESDTDTLGKQQGADQALNKPTYPALLGMDAAKAKAEELYQQAIAALDRLDIDCSRLKQLADFIVRRRH